MLIAHLNLIEPLVDVEELSARLKNLKLEWKLYNDIGFCPHLICVRNPDDGTIYIDNTNDGHLSGLRKKHIVIDCPDVENFLSRIADFTGYGLTVGQNHFQSIDSYGDVHEENGVDVLF